MKKKVMIAGASRGLGLALVEGYLNRGFDVYACMRNTQNKACETLKDKFGGGLQLVALDVSRTDSVRSAAAEVAKQTDFLDIIINNAGIHAEDSSRALEEMEVDNCLEVYNLNTLGPLRVAKEFVKFLEKGSMKVLANISSEAGSISNCGREKEFDYCMSKAALNMQSKQLQNYLKHRAIKVLAIHPGWVRTDMGGPNAHFAPAESAGFVMDIIEKFHMDLNGPVYLNYDGKELTY